MVRVLTRRSPAVFCRSVGLLLIAFVDFGGHWASSQPTSSVLLDADFAQSQQSFAYGDDLFRGTSAPAYARGTYANGNVQVVLGGIDDAVVNGMSGGWSRSFSVTAQQQNISVAVTYRLEQSAFYESNEFSQVLCSVDGTLLPVVAQLTGDGNSGPVQVLGPRTTTVNAAATLTLAAGTTHTIVVGGYNNAKTLANEVTTIAISRVTISATAAAGPVPTPVAVPTPVPAPTIGFRASFGGGTTDGFTYRDNIFRGASAAGQYARGDLQDAALKVTLGGVDGNSIGNMSGGWERSFNLATATRMTLSLRYRLRQAGTEEANDLSQALVSFDGRLLGQKPYDVLAQLSGDGNAGPTVTTGWKTFQTDLGSVAAGSHTIAVGGFLNQKSAADEVTEIFFDDIVVEPTVGPAVDPTVFPQRAVDRLDLARFKSNIATLASFGDRLQGSQSYLNAANWVAGQLQDFGFVVDRAAYQYQGAPRDSIYVTKVGLKYPDRMFIVSAHLDGRGNGGAADDDASGCSLVLEMARVLGGSDVRTDVSVRLVFWNNEESGLNGSTGYVTSRRSLQGIENPAGSGRFPEPTWFGIIQHDMILFDHGVPPQINQIANADCDVEYQASSIFSPLSRQLAEALRQGNSRYADNYPAEVTNDMSNTDSVPFQDVAPSCSFRENRRRAEIGSGANPNWHQSTDVYATYNDLDFLFGFNIVQTTLGTIAELVDLSFV